MLVQWSKFSSQTDWRFSTNGSQLAPHPQRLRNFLEMHIMDWILSSTLSGFRDKIPASLVPEAKQFQLEKGTASGRGTLRVKKNNMPEVSTWLPRQTLWNGSSPSALPITVVASQRTPERETEEGSSKKVHAGSKAHLITQTWQNSTPSHTIESWQVSSFLKMAKKV